MILFRGKNLARICGALVITAALIGVDAVAPSPAAAAPGVPLSQTHGVDQPYFKVQIDSATNAHRKSHNQSTLKSSRHLERIAQNWANTLSNSANITHNNRVASQVQSARGWSFTGENVAQRRYSANVDAKHYDGSAAMNSWKASLGHNQNLINSHHTHIGIGVAHSARHGMIYVQVFARNTNAGDDKLYAQTSAAGKSFTRVGGTDRYLTSVAVSRETHPGKADVVYLAAGSNFPDALAAVPAAARQNAPLLLMPQHGAQVPDAIRTRIHQLQPKEIVVVGGHGAISQSAMNRLTPLVPGAKITRIGGDDRYETASALVNSVFAGVKGGTVYVATARDFPDALSASAVAASNGAPVILVDGKLSSAPSATVRSINALAPSRIVVVGGDGVVSKALFNQLGKLASTSRLAGNDRFATNAAVNASASSSSAYIATGFDFPDALSGSLLAGTHGTPLYLSDQTCVPRSVHSQASTAKNVTLIGGTGVLSRVLEGFRSC